MQRLLCVLVDRVGTGLKLEVALRYRSWKFAEIFSFGCKIPSWCVLTQKNGNVDESRHWQFIPFFGGRLGLLEVGYYSLLLA